jgi:hypothetical protein
MRAGVVMFHPVRAEAFEPSMKAVLPCGCTGVMLGHGSEDVEFGIEQTACGQHRQGEIAMVGRNALLTPTESFDPFSG